MEKHDKRLEWDMVIRPQDSLFKLNLRDVWRYRDLLVLLVKRDFISFYKQTILGPLWFFIQPLFTTVIFVFVFGRLAKLSTDGIPPTLFYMSGVVSWNYFAECLTKTSTVFKDNANILGKVYFPRLVMPLSIVVSNLVRFGVQLLLLFITITWFALKEGYDFSITGNILLLPLMILLMATLGLGAGMIISAMTTKYRDLVFLVTFGVQLLMYATPVIYPLSAASEKIRTFIEYNPMSPVMEGIRLALFGKGDLTAASLGYGVFASIFVLVLGTVVFNRVEKSFADTV